MEVRKYKVSIYLDGEEWGTYELFAANIMSAAFIAGMKYRREETPVQAETIVYVNVWTA